MLGTLFAIPFPDWLRPEIVSIGPITLRWYGLAYLVGWFGALLWGVRTARNAALFQPVGATRGIAKVPGKQALEDYAFWLFFGILLGGRLGSMILYEPKKYIADPLAIFRIWEGGMAFHGGLLGVCAAIFLFARRKGFEVFRMSDLAAIGAPIGLFLGRLANFVNQELLGHETDVPWGVVFDTGGPMARHPSQIYEALLEGALLFFILYVLTRRFRILTRPGIASGVFIAGYGVFRMIVEQFRVPDADLILGMSRGTAYSVPMVIVGGAMIAWALSRKPVEPVFATVEEPEAA